MVKNLFTILFGVVICLVAVALLGGLAGYVGIWLCYVRSIVDFIEVCKAPSTDGMAVLGCLARWFIGGPLSLFVGIWGFVIAGGGGLTCIGIGAVGVSDDIKQRRKLKQKAALLKAESQKPQAN